MEEEEEEVVLLECENKMHSITVGVTCQLLTVSLSLFSTHASSCKKTTILLFFSRHCIHFKEEEEEEEKEKE